ncbi:carbohydrate ABC transporter permease [Halococcus agarilyticus]|uniref:carbohydrate ABC transporter permease n=1 Tax=Halococcus agarilyticus TaxID=1232219 RepID=UPI000677A2E8|nr:carbohydrate ABC transporter permease [Halococcus agarilyticus]
MAIENPLTSDESDTEEQAYSTTSEHIERLAKYSTKTTIAFIAVLTGFPLYYLLIASTYPQGGLGTFPPQLLPSGHAIENYTFLLTETIFPGTLLNSVIYAGGTTLGMLIISAPAGYALAKIDFRGSTTMLIIVLVMMAIPFQLMSIPLFEMAVNWGLINTYFGAIITSVTIPLAVFFVKQNAEQVLHDDLLDSARVNGASEFQVFKNIVLPLLWPALIAISMYIFITRMQSYYWPLIILRNEDVMVAQVWISIWEGGIETPTPFHRILPASVIIVLPLLITFLLGQKYFVKGLTGGSIKG